MRILIAEDDPTTRQLLEVVLTRWGYDVVLTADGIEAWEALKKPDSPNLIILDRMMPGMNGLEVCRKVRENDSNKLKYIIHLTSMSKKEEIVEGFSAGANDYITKPFNHAELEARVAAGVRMIELQSELSSRVIELEEALAYIKKLHGILPICSYCHKIRNTGDSWQRMEEYIEEHSEAKFSHSYCPDCIEKYYPVDE